MTMQLATESVDSVKFSFLTSEEVESYSFKQVTSVELLDNLDRPVPGGLYDPALGPLEDHTICKSCGQSSFFCTGHCGHIEFICPIFNPLLFDVLFNIVRKMCFSCHHFMDARDPVEKCASQAELILKGEIDAASNGDVVLQNDLSVLDGNGAKDTSDHLKGKIWTSLQYSRAMSMLDDFMKIKKKKCTRCMFKSPKITQPTFGWIHMDTPDSTIRRNVLREYTQSSIDEAEQEFITGGAENANDSCTRGIETDDDLQSSGAVYDGTPNSSTKAFRDLGEGNVPSEFGKQKTLSKGPLLPSEVKDHLKLLWDNETQLCSLICDIHRERLSMSEKKRSYSMFFIDVLLVPPVKFRPLTKGGDSVTHHPQTVLLSRVLQSNIDLCNALNNDRSQMENRSLVLQQSVNVLFGNKKSFGQRDNMGMGICQLLEKKEGLFRQKMMGKRVNYSCRSVISPDPYLAVNEIGIPPCFALKLTYPERVTDWNVKKLRNAILNGPDIHPGATEYSDQFSTRKLSNIGKMRTSVSKKFTTSRGDTSRGDVTKPGRSVEHEHEGKVVSRHLQDGDIVLVNRQPTLHKPGIMAHVVRVLNGEKTIRMHYANCSTYNADFDGDEMNVHFPQDEIARAEAFHIVNANNQYIIPTSGDTKRGLIQDHIVSGVLLTKKDTFLSRDEYTHLLYSSGLFAAGRGSFVGKSGQKVSAIVSEDEIELLVPAILKPEPLWTGKQVITSLLNRMTKGEGLPPFTFEAKCTIDEDIWTSQCGDDVQFRILKNDFLNGVVDKAQFGKYGMVHTVQELYGSKTAGALLSGLSRLFTVFLQLHGFTCGVDDLLLKQNIDIERRTKLKDANKIVESVYLKFVKGEDDQGKHSEKIDLQSKPVNAKDENKERKELQVCIEKKVRDHGESTISLLDKMMSSAANVLTNAVNTIIFPKKTKSLSEDKSNVESADKSKDKLAENLKGGFSKPFPKNCFSLMTISGAKGGQVNFSQVSSLLGQQSLEGKRVPLMISGKTLPCFPPWDPALRAGGFITDCFLTGLRPQEYYFHCMAGREGLVDTAVKTSRSGYLQRCLVKNLECLMVGYDRTVRDADGSIVQFCYGEDGVDVHKTSFMAKFDTLTSNHSVVLGRLMAQCKDDLEKSKDDHLTFDKCIEKLKEDHLTFDNYIEKLPLKLVEVIYPEKKEGKEKPEKKEQHSSLVEKSRKLLPKEEMMKLMILKYLSSLAQPGEPVGVIAAQSVGEPSTQMTLNTFHHAGQKDSNVTLGIPRLQEILMRASERILTPIMSCPLRKGKKGEDAERLARSLRKVAVADVIKSMQVSVVPFFVQKHQASAVYKLKVELYPIDMYPKHSNIDLDDCEKTLKSIFVPELVRAIDSHVAMLSKIAGIVNIVQKGESDLSEGTDEADPCNKVNRKGEEDDGSDDDVDAEDLDFDAQKGKLQNSDEKEYEDGMGSEYIEGEASGFESEIDQVELEDDNSSDDKAPTIETDDKSKVRSVSKPKSVKKLKSEAQDDTCNDLPHNTGGRIFVPPSFKEHNFEVHFRSANEPHILLSQIAQKVAKNVYIKKLAKIDRCSVFGDTKTADIHTSGETKTPDIQTSADTTIPERQRSGDTKIPEIQTSGDSETPEINPIGIETSGVDFHALWDMQDDLDIRLIESNDIHGILKTFGVEAARATIVKELSKVFDLYGIKTDFRHLSLIADFMTQSGKYRPMSRHGMADSISPFSKMSFETASTFILNAAYRGEVDNLESPSASICLGQPVKMGTGCFDLMQKVQV